MIPPTIHPMLVHFPIALLFTAFLFDVLGMWRRDRFFERAGMALLWLTLLSVAAAIGAGLYAASHVLISPAVAPILRAHRRDGLLTGFAIALVVVLRLRFRRRTLAVTARGTPWQDAFRIWAYPLGAYVLALVMISVTGDAGGRMVYSYGLGVAAAPSAVSSAQPSKTSTSSSKTPTSSSQTQAVSSGQKIYQTTCTRCHGPTPPFNHSLVSSMGQSGMQQFISTRMPPGNPVSSTQAKALVAYFNSL